MSTAFISYSTKDSRLALGLHSAMTMAGISTFLAEISIEAGKKWSEVIFESLAKSDWVFFLASKNSISSPAVQQELGASLSHNKQIIPLLIDITPEELPQGVDKHQAIDIRSSPEKLHAVISEIAKKIKVDEFWAGVIVGAILVGLMVLVAKS